MPVDNRVLAGFTFFRSLQDTELSALAAQVREVEFPASARIFADGDAGDYFYLIASGKVEIRKDSVEGEAVLNVLHEGGSFGEMSLLDSQPRSAAAIAVTDVTLVEVPKTAFLSLVQQNPLILYQTALQSDQRLRERDRQWIGELETRNRHLQRLYDTSLDITRRLNLSEALAAIAGRSKELLAADDGCVCLYDEASDLLVLDGAAKNIGPNQGATRQAFLSNQTVILSHTGGTELAAPILLEGRVLGTLTVNRPHGSTPFGHDEARLLLLFANQAAIAIENARLYALAVEKGRLDGELGAARRLQQSLMPKRAPRVPGFQLAGLWRPAFEMSGDWYDFFPLPNRRWGIVIADVSGKGVPAALFMALARSTLRASAAVATTAEGAVERANRLIAADSDDGTFITAVFGILDAQARRFVYVNAGHNPPLWFQAGAQRLEYLTRTGLPLGIDENLRFRAHEIELQAGDMLYFYTDGVTEAMGANEEMFGTERLEAIVTTAGKHGDARKLVQTVDKELRGHTGAHLPFDDVTMVAISARLRASARLPASARPPAES